MQNLADLRKTYTLGSLSETDVSPNPLLQFQLWFEQAQSAKCPEPNAMTLSTVNSKGIPSSRIVLLKNIQNEGFTFFTNYESQKGQEILQNPHVALLFFWHELERQVRIEGTVQKVSAAMSDAYYESRPIGSKIGAWASPQSRTIPNREYLEGLEREFSNKFGSHPPRPEHWGGYVVNPSRIEFWQGRPSRLHDRLSYKKSGSTWAIERLAP